MILRWKVALFLVAGLALPAWARAGTVTIQSIGGPGGNSFASGAFGSQAIVGLTYTSVNFIDVALNVSAGGSYELYEGGDTVSVANSTGKPWLGFTFSILTSPPGTQLTGADPDVFGNFKSVAVTPSLITYSGGTVPAGLIAAVASFGPAIDFSTTGPGTVIIRETPLLTTAVPEPSALVQGATASVLACVGLAWRCLRTRGWMLAGAGCDCSA